MRRFLPILFATVAACAGSKAAPEKSVDESARVKAVVDAPDRTPEDRSLDAGRKPAETLAFLHISPGMRVADLGAGGGYTTELLARAVAPDGVVYAQNPDLFLKSFLKDVWPARLSRPPGAGRATVSRCASSSLDPPALGALRRGARDLPRPRIRGAGDPIGRAPGASLRPRGEGTGAAGRARPWARGKRELLLGPRCATPRRRAARAGAGLAGTWPQPARARGRAGHRSRTGCCGGRCAGVAR